MDVIHIFIAFSHVDIEFKEKLRTFLKPLIISSRGKIEIWDDGEIHPGHPWDPAIKRKLNEADIILLLVSADSLASTYFYEEEMEISLQRQIKGEAEVIPIIIRHCVWEITPLAKLEVLPEKALPIESWKPESEGFKNVVEGIGKVVHRIPERRIFAKAVLEAGELMNQQRWPEAREQYHHALSLHRPGFSPDLPVLQQLLDDCSRREKELTDSKAYAARKIAFERTLIRAGTLFSQQNWAEALRAYREAYALQEPEFPMTAARKRIDARISACEQALQVKRKVETQHSNRAPVPHARYRRWLPFAGLALLILSGIYWMWPLDFFREKQAEKQDITATPSRQDMAPLEEDSLFRVASKLSDFQRYLDQYPNGRYKERAQAKIDTFQIRIKELSTDALLSIKHKHPDLAHIKLDSALRISPADTILLKLKKCPDFNCWLANGKSYFINR